MNKKIFFPVLLLAATFIACSSDDDPSIDTSRKMTVEVSETPLVPEGDEARQMDVTRTAEATTTASLDEFSMNYMESKYDFIKTGSGWNSHDWPSGPGFDDVIDFYAYNAGRLEWNSGKPYVSFKMDEDVANQKDLLVATRSVSKNGCGGVVSLNFHHACAAVQFQICMTKTVSEKHNFVVKEVILKNVKNQGDYSYSEGWKDVKWSSSWEADESKRIYTLTSGDINLTTDYQKLPCNWLFLIPQTQSGLSLEVKYTVDNVADVKTKVINLDDQKGTWASGYEYTINIRVGTSFV